MKKMICLLIIFMLTLSFSAAVFGEEQVYYTLSRVEDGKAITYTCILVGDEYIDTKDDKTVIAKRYDKDSEVAIDVNSQRWGVLRFVSPGTTPIGIGPNGGEIGDLFKPTMAAILGVLAILAGAVAVGMLIAIGIKFMSRGAGYKADAKETLVPYFIGAVLVSGASTFASAALSFFK